MGFAMLSFAFVAARPANAQINPYSQSSPHIGATDSDDDPARSTGNVPGVAGFSGRGLAISASMNSRYESNLSRRQAADDGLRFQPRVSADYGLGSSRLGLFVEGSYGRDIVIGNRLFRGGDRTNVSTGINFALSSCSGELGGSYRKSLNLRNDAARFGAFQQQTTTFGFAGSCRIGRALSINAGVSRSDSENTRSVSQALNVERLTYSAGLGFNANALGQLSLTGSISNIDLPGRLVVTPDGIVEDGFLQRSVRFGIARAFGSRIRMSAGVSIIDNKPGTESSLIIVDGLPQVIDRGGFTGLGYDGALDFNLSSRLSLQFTANRNVNSNPFVGAFLVISNGYAVSASTKVGQYDVSAGARFRQSQFQGGFISQFDPVVRRSDRFQSYFLRIGGRLGQRIRASLELNHNRRISNPAVLSFTSTGAGLNLSVAFGRGSR